MAQSEPSLHQPLYGRLVFERAPVDDYGKRMQALLYGAKDELLTLPLQYAQILRIDTVIHIAGIEYYSRSAKGRPEKWKQSWLCAIDPVDALPLLRRVVIDSVTGFSPEDDDFGE